MTRKARSGKKGGIQRKEYLIEKLEEKIMKIFEGLFYLTHIFCFDEPVGRS